MNEDFNRFYKETILKTQPQDSDLNFGNANEDDLYENSVCLSKQETIFMRSFDKSHCFVITVPEEFLDHKNILVKNLELLKEFMLKIFGSHIS